MRITSLTTWQAIQESGIVSTMRLEVYNWLFSNGPATANELNAGAKADSELSPSYHKRLSELERMGLVETVGERVCSITGRRCLLWRTTDLASPIPLAKHSRNKTSTGKALERALSAMDQSLDLETRAAAAAIRRELI